ncbi:Germin-like protein 3-1 [Canna indica]|uniref:Germin-like protein 3-1 n=1 Tax=Canna indica TaxID=4628 RepID=A0AAQ3K4N3_9LILI|nr:Germin-like protein 3-1 [Canna indica]
MATTALTLPSPSRPPQLPTSSSALLSPPLMPPRSLVETRSLAMSHALLLQGEMLVGSVACSVKCVPCKVIAPKFQKLSEKHLDVVFMKLDRNQGKQGRQGGKGSNRGKSNSVVYSDPLLPILRPAPRPLPFGCAAPPGELLLCFIDTSYRLYTQQLRLGDAFVFPRGSIHFLYNIDVAKPTVVLSGFNSRNTGVQLVPIELFRMEPQFMDEVQKKASRSEGRMSKGIITGCRGGNLNLKKNLESIF